MKRNELIKILHQFENITPNKAYSERSKNIILSVPFTPTLHEEVSFASATANLRTISFASFFQGIWRGLAVAGAVAGVFLIIYLTTSQLSPLFLPGLNKHGVIAEADMVNASINVQLSHIQRFEQTASESATVLKEVAANTPNHLSESVIKDEQSKINSESPAGTTSPAASDINDILNTLTK